jgi:protein KRI1
LVRAALEALDLDGDWDANAYDQQMAAVLAETDSVGADGNDKKPAWDDDIDIDDIVPPSRDDARSSAAKERKKAKKKERKKRLREDEVDAVDVDEMDADELAHGGTRWDEVEWDGTEEMRKHVLDQYMEELYELEFNDMVRPHSLPAAPHTTFTLAYFRLQGCLHTFAMSL